MNNARTPVAFCIQLNNLLPNTIYNLAAGLAATTDLTTSMGAGGVWNGASYGLNISNAFTTNANGSSGPVWIYMQPSGNSSRFGAGQVHNLRIAYSNTAFGAITSPNFISTNTITSLDIASTALSANTADDGAFVRGNLNACMGGKLVLVYDNGAFGVSITDVINIKLVAFSFTSLILYHQFLCNFLKVVTFCKSNSKHIRCFTCPIV